MKKEKPNKGFIQVVTSVNRSEGLVTFYPLRSQRVEKLLFIICVCVRGADGQTERQRKTKTKRDRERFK